MGADIVFNTDEQAELLVSAKDLDIFAINHNALILRLSSLDNVKLLKEFKETFTKLDGYPANQLEKSHIFEIGRIFKEEFYSRIGRSSDSSLKEFAGVMLEYIDRDVTGPYQADGIWSNSFYTNYLVRFFSHCTTAMKVRGMDRGQIKKEILR